MRRDSVATMLTRPIRLVHDDGWMSEFTYAFGWRHANVPECGTDQPDGTLDVTSPEGRAVRTSPERRAVRTSPERRAVRTTSAPSGQRRWAAKVSTMDEAIALSLRILVEQRAALAAAGEHPQSQAPIEPDQTPATDSTGPLDPPATPAQPT
jgi:hypothetical protein